MKENAKYMRDYNDDRLYLIDNLYVVSMEIEGLPVTYICEKYNEIYVDVLGFKKIAEGDALDVEPLRNFYSDPKKHALTKELIYEKNRIINYIELINKLSDEKLYKRELRRFGFSKK